MNTIENFVDQFVQEDGILDFDRIRLCTAKLLLSKAITHKRAYRRWVCNAISAPKNWLTDHNL